MSSLPTITSQDAEFIEIANKLAIESSAGKLQASMEKIKEYLKSMEDMIDNGFRNVDLCLPENGYHDSPGKTVLSMLLQMVRILDDPNVNDPTKEPGTLFKPLIKKLVQHGANCDANVEVDDDGNITGDTPFWLAAELGLLDVVKEMLLTKRVKYLDVFNSEGFGKEEGTALYLILSAASLWINEYKHLPILQKIETSIALAKELVLLGSDCDRGPQEDGETKGMTPLLQAVAIGDPELISLMLSMGAKDYSASTEDSTNVIDCLIENASTALDKEEVDKAYQFLQFIGQLFIPAEKASRQEIIACLLKHAETLSGAAEVGDTDPLYLSRERCFSLITHLLSPGENPDIEEQVLKEICKTGNDVLLRKILKKGVVFPPSKSIEEPVSDFLEIVNKEKRDIVDGNIYSNENHGQVREILKAVNIVWKKSGGYNLVIDSSNFDYISEEEFSRNVKFLSGCLNARMPMGKDKDSITAVQYAVRRKKWNLVEILLSEDAMLKPDPDLSSQYQECYTSNPMVTTFVSLAQLQALAKDLQEAKRKLQKLPMKVATPPKNPKDIKEGAESSAVAETPQSLLEKEKEMHEKFSEKLETIITTFITQMPKILNEQLRSHACFRVLTLFSTFHLDEFIAASGCINTFRILLRHLIINTKTAELALEHFPKAYGKKSAPLKSSDLSLDEADSNEEFSVEAAKIMIQCQLALSGLPSFEGSLLASTLLQIMGIEDTLKDVVALSSKTAEGVIVNCLTFFKSRYISNKDSVFLTQKKSLTFSSSSSLSSSSSSSNLSLITTPSLLSASVPASTSTSAEKNSSTSSNVTHVSNLSSASNALNISSLSSVSNTSSVSTSAIDDNLLSSTTHHPSVFSTSTVVSSHHARGDSVLGKRDIDAVAADITTEQNEDTVDLPSKKFIKI